MKTIFLETRSREKIKLGKEAIEKLPEKIALATTIQFISSIDNIKKELESAGKKVKLIQGIHSAYKGQMLGCDITKNIAHNLKDKNFDAFLFVGDGLFHPKMMLFAQEEEKKLDVTNDLIVQLSEKGKKLVYTLGLRRQAQVNKPWRKCPEEFKQTKIDISTPYAPKISSLDKEIVSKILRNKNGS